MGACSSGSKKFDNKAAKDDLTEILPNELYISSLACADYHFLVGQEVRTVVSIGNEVRLESRRDFRVKLLALEDRPDARIEEHIDQICAFIHLHLRKGKLLVHCEQGRSRSATIVLAYLIRYRRMNLEEAFKFVEEKRWIRPNVGFIGALLKFEKEELVRRNGVNSQTGAQPSTVFVAKYLMDSLMSPEAAIKHKVSVAQVVEALEDSNFDASAAKTRLLQEHDEVKGTPRPSA